MFEKQYRFYGKHARQVEYLTGALSKDSKAKLFEKNIDVYVNAPLIGFLYQRTADINRDKDPSTGDVPNESVFADMMIKTKDQLDFNFKLIMLLDSKYEPDAEKRIDKAFRNVGKDPRDEERYDSYVRGGVEILYESLIEGSGNIDDYVVKLQEFISFIQEKYNDDIDKDALLDLCVKG